MRLRRVGVCAGGGLFVGWLLLNAAVAVMAAEPHLQAAVFGTPSVHRRTPADVGLAYRTVDYAPRRDAWWVPAAVTSAPTVVIIHGYSTVPDPKSAEFSPAVELAEALHAWHFNVLVINLGYATGVHPYSGGPAEARDVALAAAWAHEHGGNVALWGFSAGGHAALLAAAAGAPVAAVITDSAFVDAGAIMVDQAARTTHLPRFLLTLAPVFQHWVFGASPADLRRVLRRHRVSMPLLLIQGSGDTAVPPANLAQLQELTHGQAWLVPHAQHTKSYWQDPTGYLARAHTFLSDHLR